MHQSDHDKVAEAKREAARVDLINHYIEVAINRSAEDEYGFLNVMGHEVPDPTVIEPPLGYIPQPDLMEQMRRMVQNEMSRIAALQEFETFEEADDFDIDEDPVDYTTPYEMYFDPPAGEPAGPPADSNARPDPNAPPAPPPPSTPPPAGGGGAQPPSES